MSEIPNVPPARGDASHIADFAEIECLRHDKLSVSVFNISHALDDASTDDGVSGVPWDEAAPEAEDGGGDENPDLSQGDVREGDALEVREDVDAAFNDVEARREHCGPCAFYPFRRDGENRGRIVIDEPQNGKQRWHALLYLFLLWLTRISGSASISGNNSPDPAARKLFERLCCEVASNYWGRGIAGETPPFIHFGAPGNFRAKIENLAQQLGEGGGLREEALKSGRTPQDDGVDIVVYRPFADGRVGQLIGLGQCKSGRGYGRNDLAELQPGAFFQTWFRGRVSRTATESVRLFFLSDRIANDEVMFQHSNRAGILFDRCRIMEYAGEMDSDLKREIAKWILARLGEHKTLGRLEAAGINLRSAVK